MNERLIIFCDYGLDDAVATCYLFNNNRWRSIDIVAIGGNTTATNSLNNAQKLIANYDGILPNITLVDTTDKIQFVAELPSIHGLDGMGDLYTDVASPMDTIAFDEWLSNLSYTNSIDIASFGPATLVVPVIQKLGIDKCNILMMGHNINEVPNHLGEEFNFVLDIPSFEWCLNNTNCVVASLDTCRHPAYNLATKPMQGDSVLATLINKSIYLATLRHPDNAYIYDYIAARHLIVDEFKIDKAKDKRGNIVNLLRHKD
ncbi:MAG: nucleoside hydrolase [Firmicutes bacterium]|nr:nucleoside hydrolase [Bacillota bacterium]MCL1953690.1 nucleoside hydrolase [Bacillota bacterium]